jgi:aminopeptidase N
MSKKVKRLFEQFQTAHYDVDITLDQVAMTFTGVVRITGHKVGRPTNRLTFHQKGLKITKAQLVRHDKHGNSEIVVARINHHASFNEVRIHTDALLPAGSYEIIMEYSGRITRQMEGVYPCNFTHDGEAKQLIATQFESHHAREAFPCIDEPEAKATFQLSIAARPDHTVVSNTPSVSTKKEGTLQRTYFGKSPVMSTYLVAFVVGDLRYLEAKTKNGVVVRTYATPDNVEHTQFALDVAVRCLEFYNDYFGIDYPLEKCDLLALPDFASGAMENWGCITFREHALLVDEHNTSLSSKQYVAMVVAHELAHQWFGNLVTMRWWTDLWLNEGFASWIEYLAVDELFPKWKMWTQFIIDEQQQALKLDALEHTHPVEVTVHHPDEIRTIFDAISYSKGASIIHMLYSYLGPDAFRTGLQYYLTKHMWANTETADLWAALEEASEKPVRTFMAAWTSQPGFPIIKAMVDDGKIELTQQRFYTNPHHNVTESLVWPVPLQAKSPAVPHVMESATATYELADHHDFKLNRNHGGFYRVAYNSSHTQRLGQLVKKGHLSATDRLGILGDLIEASKAGMADTADTLHFLQNFAEEDDYAVWDNISGIIGSIRMVMGDEELREAMKPFILRLTAKQLKRLGWDRKSPESHFDRLLRPIILGMASSADEPTIVKRCWDLFESIEHSEDIAPHLKSNPSRKNVRRGLDIDPDLRGTVFGTVARQGGQTEFDKLLRLHNESSSSEERTTLAAALTSFKDPAIISQALAQITSDTVRLQDVAYWVAYSFLNRHARTTTWDWLKDNWEWLHENLGNDLSFYRMPIYAARTFHTPKFREEFEAFFTPHMTPAMERSYNQGLEMIDWQSAWKQRDQKEVKNFFKNVT